MKMKETVPFYDRRKEKERNSKKKKEGKQQKRRKREGRKILECPGWEE